MLRLTKSARRWVQRWTRPVCLIDCTAAALGTDGACVVAITYVTHKTHHVFPVIGGHQVEHLYANIEISLSREQTAYHGKHLSVRLGIPARLLPTYALNYKGTLVTVDMTSTSSARSSACTRRSRAQTRCRVGPSRLCIHSARRSCSRRREY